MALIGAPPLCGQAHEVAGTGLGPRRQVLLPESADRRDAFQLGRGVPEGKGVPANYSAMIVAGSLFGVAAVVGGALIGDKMDPCDCEVPGPGDGVVWGAGVLPAVTIPVVAHVMNDGRGSFVVTTGSSIVASGIAALATYHGDGYGALMAAVLVPPIAALITSVAVEGALTH